MTSEFFIPFNLSNREFRTIYRKYTTLFFTILNVFYTFTTSNTSLKLYNLKDYEKSKNRKPLGRSTHRARRYGCRNITLTLGVQKRLLM